MWRVTVANSGAAVYQAEKFDTPQEALEALRQLVDISRHSDIHYKFTLEEKDEK